VRAILLTITTVFLQAALALSVGAQQQFEVSLVAAQQRALESNKMLEVGRAGVAEAEGIQLQTWAGHLPSISVSERALRTNNALSAFGFRLSRERVQQSDFVPEALNNPGGITHFQTVLEVQQPLFNGGQTIYGRRQARAGVQAAQAQLRRGEQEVRLHTAEGYWGLVLAREGLAAVRQALETARSHADQARAHYEQQTAPLSDLLAAQVRVAELRGEEIAAQNRVAAGTDELSLVMGLASGVTVVPVDTLVYREMDASLDKLTGQALAGRADLTAAALKVAGAGHGVQVARAELLPHLNAFAQIGLDSEKLLERQGESWTVGAMVTWKIFSGFASVGAVRQARAQQRQARARREFLAAQTTREVAQDWRSVKAAQAQVGIAQEAVQQAEERLRMTDLQYQETLVTATDLLDAETALTQTRIRRLQALHGLNVGLARMEFAVGRSLDNYSVSSRGGEK